MNSHFMGFRQLHGPNIRTNNTNHFYSSRKNKINGHFMGFRQLDQKLERITPINSTLQEKQYQWSFYGFSSTGSKLERIIRIIRIICTLQDKQNHWSFYKVSRTGSRVRPNDANHFTLQKKQMNGHFLGFRELVQERQSFPLFKIAKITDHVRLKRCEFTARNGFVGG